MCFRFVADMEEKLSTIIEESAKLFMKFGIRSLTMDDVAKNLRISKKTLYQFVSDKDDLVTKCIDAACDRDCTYINQVVDEHQNAIEELLAISQYVSQRLNNIHPSIFFDLEKYHPEAMGRFEKHRNEYIASSIKRNLEAGIEQGVYRKNLNTDIIARIYLSCVDNVLHGDLARQSELNMSLIYQEMVSYHLHGVASEKGLKYLEKLNNNQESK